MRRPPLDGGPGSGPDPTTYGAIRMVGPSPDGGTGESVFVSDVDGEVEYCDLDSDPLERTNTAAALDAATVARYQTVVSAIQGCKGAAACWAAQHMCRGASAARQRRDRSCSARHRALP